MLWGFMRGFQKGMTHVPMLFLDGCSWHPSFYYISYIVKKSCYQNSHFLGKILKLDNFYMHSCTALVKTFHLIYILTPTNDFFIWPICPFWSIFKHFWSPGAQQKNPKSVSIWVCNERSWLGQYNYASKNYSISIFFPKNGSFGNMTFFTI